MTTITLPPLPSHPESMVFAWSPLEQQAIQVYALEVAWVVLEGAAKACLEFEEPTGPACAALKCATAIALLEVKHHE